MNSRLLVSATSACVRMRAPSYMHRANPIGRSQGSTARAMCSTGAASHAQHARPSGTDARQEEHLEELLSTLSEEAQHFWLAQTALRGYLSELDWRQ